MEKNGAKAQQTSIILPHFDYEVPVVHMEDGTLYIPLVALCEMLGLRADTHIPRWRRLDGKRRTVWCLHMVALLLWFSCFDWSLVPPERRTQLRQATDEWMNVLEQAHKEMIMLYRARRRTLFKFLTSYSDVKTALNHLSPTLHVYLEDFELCIEWEELISQGKILISKAVTCAQRMLCEQDSMPIIDVVSLNTDDEIIDEFSMLLFPIVKKEDTACFLDYFTQLTR